MRDTAITALGNKQHLVFPRIRAERPAVTEYHGLPCAPVFVIDLCAVFGGEYGHCGPPMRRGAQTPRVGWCVYAAPAVRSLASTSGTFTRCSLRNQTWSSLVRRTSLTSRSLVPSSPNCETRRASLRVSAMIT